MESLLRHMYPNVYLLILPCCCSCLGSAKNVSNLVGKPEIEVGSGFLREFSCFQTEKTIKEGTKCLLCHSN
jgi:hypothetical protein